MQNARSISFRYSFVTIFTIVSKLVQGERHVYNFRSFLHLSLEWNYYFTEDLYLFMENFERDLYNRMHMICAYT